MFQGRLRGLVKSPLTQPLLCASTFFSWSERDRLIRVPLGGGTGEGHADISLEPLLARYRHLRTGYLIELKYLARRAGGRKSAWRRQPAKLRRSCGAIWPTSAWHGNSRPSGSRAWRWCSTAGRWCSATRWRSELRERSAATNAQSQRELHAEQRAAHA